MGGIAPLVACLGTTLGVCTKPKDVARAESLLETPASSGLGNPNMICVKMVITACGKNGQVERAAIWLQRMHSLGIEPDVMIYNTVIDGCARSGEVDKADEWHSKMQDSGAVPNVVSFSYVLHACAEAGEATRSEAWL